MKPPAMRPRPGGGFNPGLGQFNDHLDEQSMQSAMKQKALSQMAGAQTGPAPAGSTGGNPLAGMGGMAGAGSPSIFDAVITQPVQDLAKTFLEALHLDKILGFSGDNDTPEQKAKKGAMHKRYQQLTEEQQAVARQKYQERLQKEKAQREQEEQRKRMEEQRKAESVVVPTSVKKGPEGPGGGKSKKSNAIQKLQQDRKTLNGPQSAG